MQGRRSQWSTFCALLILIASSTCVSLDGVQQVNPNEIKFVHVISMNHLDVGFNGIGATIGYAVNVINKYFDVYFPLAIDTASKLRAQGGEAQLIYTTHAWLVAMYLDCEHSGIPVLPYTGVSLHCPNATALKAFTEAVDRGDITWHAFPFNAEAEVMDGSLFTFGVQMAHDLDIQFKKRKSNTMSQRDVPGTTRSIIPLLRAQGVEALSVGVNGASSPPAVPNPFVWKDTTSGTDILAMWHPGGYGGIAVSDCVMVEGLTHALAFAFRGDNAGPPGVDEVKQNFVQLQQEFPNAKIMASTYDSFTDELLKVKDSLPVLTSEIGDTWIYGVPSDPLKLAQFRAVMRLRSECLTLFPHECNPNDLQFKRFSRLLIKAAEHTWGVDVKKFLHDWVNWSNDKFEKARNGSNYQILETSWLEQRAYITNAIAQLGDSPLVSRIEKAFAELNAQVPSTDGFQAVSNPTTATLSFGDVSIGFNAQGGFRQMLDHSTGTNWASEGHPFAQFLYQTFDQGSYDTFLSEYMYCPISDCTWAGMDFGKPNVSVGQPQARMWQPTLKALWQKNHHDGVYTLLVQAMMEEEAYTKYGSPREIWTEIVIDPLAKKMKVNLQIFDKTSTRLPEALYFTFNPVEQDGWNWVMDKMGLEVSPLDVVHNGSQHLHGVMSGVSYQKASKKFQITSLDAGVVAPGMSTAFPTPMSQLASISQGMHYVLSDNTWGTNYIMWYPFQNKDKDSLFRFTVEW